MTFDMVLSPAQSVHYRRQHVKGNHVGQVCKCPSKKKAISASVGFLAAKSRIQVLIASSRVIGCGAGLNPPLKCLMLSKQLVPGKGLARAFEAMPLGVSFRVNIIAAF